ncbi:murein transglycosylase A [Deefgea rivuli]|uniref:murein transglycosylase A n=1 Tax=Deefgea rivuli TaxID=400948 RepID=UPI000486E102|nr:MltA domain-containing protein [Deefgea rivuli]
MNQHAIASTLKHITLASLLAGFFTACGTAPSKPTPVKPVTPAPSAETSPAPAAPKYVATTWQQIPLWSQDELVKGFQTWRNGCTKLQKSAVWATICQDAAQVQPNSAAIRSFLQSRLTPYQLQNPDSSTTGLITGYYEPIYAGSTVQSNTAKHPVYAPPSDMITVALDEVYPELKGKRLRGRLVGNKLVPFPDRAGIVKNGINAPVLAWLNDAMDVQFLQIQGSGRVKLANGTEIRLGYADQNGRPYKPVGRWLVEQGLMPAADVSMQSIRAWAQANPSRIDELLNSNPSYVFFQKLPPSNSGPIGSLGVPLTAAYSIAVDPSTIPLGSMAFIATTRPDNDGGIHRLVAAQDTGGAIRGSVRADFFWGTGDAAGELAGKMKQTGSLWLLWPKDLPLPK